MPPQLALPVTLVALEPVFLCPQLQFLRFETIFPSLVPVQEFVCPVVEFHFQSVPSPDFPFPFGDCVFSFFQAPLFFLHASSSLSFPKAPLPDPLLQRQNVLLHTLH
ncbi:hypothetical protein L211DRAFT_833967 [Terfezia boudieri ATCC MYA-4762]|uniref:Uncharacterized protein n=1 Tax=Terfezia boudieri ATCC MYA-4762 TaxID=1051890 RepID=A0A3N4LYH9_9PEZI|nr:hypothetical protein L211DRAFT_833967 [Terfezia boudieri ATCC MYA-4762]